MRIVAVMTCQIFPRFQGLFLDRFRAFRKSVIQHQFAGQSGKRGRKVDWAQDPIGINREQDEYEAITRVLLVLTKLLWSVEEDRFGTKLIARQNTAETAFNSADCRQSVHNELISQFANRSGLSAAGQHNLDAQPRQ